MNTQPPLILAPQCSASFAQRIATLLGVELGRSEEREFEGGEHKMRPLEEVRDREVFVVHQLHGDAAGSVNDKLCRLLFFIGALKDAGAAQVTACLPYLAYARKDRRTQVCDPVTTRYVARLFEAVDTDRVVVLDVHNDAAFDNAFRMPTIRLEAADLFAKHIAGTLPAAAAIAVASPDAGGMKRAHRFRTALEAQCGRSIGAAFMEKTRSGGTVSGEKFVGDVEDTHVIVYDDLIASGTTILRAARAARQAGARKIYAAAPHAVFGAGARQLFDSESLDSLFVSDSIPLSSEFLPECDRGLQVCSAAPLFAELIRRLQAKLPVTDLTVTG